MQLKVFTSAPLGGLLALPQHRRLARHYPRLGAIGAASGGPSQPPQDVPSYFQPEAPAQAPQFYQSVPQYPVPPPPPPPPPSFWQTVPPLVWIGVGFLLANAFNSAMSFMRGGGVSQKVQEMAMQQMMNQMMKQAGGAAGGSPFGGNPFAAPGGGASPFGFPPGGAPGGAGASPFGANFPSGFPSAAAAAQAPIDTTAEPAAASKSAQAAAPSPHTGTSSSTKRRSAFQDVDASPAAAAPQGAGAATGNGAAAAPPPPPPLNFAGPPPPGGSEAAAPDAGGMLDMLRNPEMQKMLYPYLPEPMRNPETFEWMLNSPEYRAQLEGMLNQQMGGGAPPPAAVQELMKDVDMSPDKMNEAFDKMGMTPQEFMQKVMSDPDLAASMTKPSVMAAIAECTKNPMSIVKYQNDPEVMTVFEKMSTLFPQAAGGGFPGGPQGGGGY